MPLFLRPRRPLLRLAAGGATAGAADRAGRRRAQQDVGDRQATDAQAAPAAVVPPPAPGAGTTAVLERLAGLHRSSALSDEEFAAAKARVLGL
ncbi:MAG TPA: SHOCT domain-containing protein [Actinomycetes bacterium]|nr:SHOCT domain-containing protein [Actinomycetes bacterium]